MHTDPYLAAQVHADLNRLARAVNNELHHGTAQVAHSPETRAECVVVHGLDTGNIITLTPDQDGSVPYTIHNPDGDLLHTDTLTTYSTADTATIVRILAGQDTALKAGTK